MAKKQHLYLQEWILFRGFNPAKLIKDEVVEKGHLSRLINNKFTKSPNPATMERLANYLNIKKEDLWQDPFDIIEQRKMFTRLDLEDWLSDPRSTLYGETVDQETRDAVRSLAKLLARKQRGQ